MWAGRMDGHGDRDILEEGVMSGTEQQQPSGAVLGDVSIRPLQGGDRDAADRVMRMAFGTFLGVPTRRRCRRPGLCLLALCRRAELGVRRGARR